MVRHARRGFTLVELLVVIAIISLLIAMLLPAIQAARESGRRAACSSNLKQFATAVHVFHERHNSMPTYYGFFPDGGNYGKGVYGSWYVHLMPVMEMQSGYQKIWDTQAAAWAANASDPKWGRMEIATIPPSDPNAVCTKTQTSNTCPGGGSYACKSTGSTSTSTHNGHSYDHSTSKCGCYNGNDYVGDHTVVKTEVVVPCGTPVMQNYGLASEPASMTPGVLFCASDPGQPVNSISWSHSQTYALSNYQANFNVFVRNKDYSKRKPQGFGAITDGQSQTVLFAEGHRMCDRYSDNWGVRVAVISDAKRHNFGVNWYEKSNTLMFQDRPTAERCDNWRVQANHGGALLVALGDASVRGISSKISRREVTNPDVPMPGVDPDEGLGNPLGNWDRLLLPDDGGSAAFE